MYKISVDNCSGSNIKPQTQRGTGVYSRDQDSVSNKVERKDQHERLSSDIYDI